MTQRNILQPNTELRFDSNSGAVSSYHVEKVIGTGSLCVLYLAYYLDNLGLKKYVKIKEYNPAKFHLERRPDLTLVVPDNEQEHFEKMRMRVVHSYLVSHALVQEDHVSNTISNAENIHEANGTIYIVYSYMKGQDLGHYQVKSLQEAIRITASVARAIRSIHEAGYLYLDVKPDNILILEGTTDLIQLFDFDSLVPIAETAEFTETRITFSKGFSAVEQRLGEWGKIGRHSDVYSIGALLFYLLYGRAPRAADCNRRKAYDFGKAKFDLYDYPDALERHLSDILMGTLQSYSDDRYSDITPLLDELAEIEKLTDPSLEYVLTQIPSYKLQLIGRDEELAAMKRWMDSREPVLIVTGMGGIGKSAIVTTALSRYVNNFDAVTYMRYRTSLTETLADDQNLCLHNLARDPAEDSAEYAQRKIAHLRRLSRETSILLVIDNYEESLTEELKKILDIGCKVLLVSRQIETEHYPVLSIRPLQGAETQYELFLHYLEHENVSDKEKIAIHEMIALLNGHTLSIELLAKQIRASFLTIAEALALIREKGFSQMGTEKVLFEKDGSASYNTVYRIISSLYELKNISEKQRSILKMLSLSDIRGVDARLFAALNGLRSAEEINVLARNGWISVQRREIFFHPLIREVILGAPWEKYDIQALNNLSLEMQNKIESNTSITEGETDELRSCLEYGRTMFSYHDLKDIMDQTLHENLWCYVAANLRRDDEEYILACARSIDASRIRSGQMLLKLWDITVRILCEDGNYEEAKALIQTAGDYLEKTSADNFALAFYYGNIVTEYYDIALSDPRMYDPRINDPETYTPELHELLWEQYEHYLDELLHANEKALAYAAASEDERAKVLQVEFTADLANFVIRREIVDREACRSILASCDALIQNLPSRQPEIEMSIHLAHMWFHTICDVDYKAASAAWNTARAIGESTCYPDIEMIDAIIVPGADMEREFGHSETSIAILQAGVAICEIHRDSSPFERKKKELEHYMEEVLMS